MRLDDLDYRLWCHVLLRTFEVKVEEERVRQLRLYEGFLSF